MSFPLLKSTENLQRQEQICCFFYANPGLSYRVCQKQQQEGRKKPNTQALLGNDRAFTRLFRGIFDFYTKQVLFRNRKQISLVHSVAPNRNPPPSVLDTPVPVWVGVDGPCDGDEQPGDESCLQGQLEGDFLGDNRDSVLVKTPTSKTKCLSRGCVTASQHTSDHRCHHPQGTAKSHCTETLIILIINSLNF